MVWPLTLLPHVEQKKTQNELQGDNTPCCSAVVTVEFRAALANTTSTSHVWLCKFKLIQVKLKMHFLGCISHISKAQ